MLDLLNQKFGVWASNFYFLQALQMILYMIENHFYIVAFVLRWAQHISANYGQKLSGNSRSHGLEN